MTKFTRHSVNKAWLYARWQRITWPWLAAVIIVAESVSYPLNWPGELTNSSSRTRQFKRHCSQPILSYTMFSSYTMSFKGRDINLLNQQATCSHFKPLLSRKKKTVSNNLNLNYLVGILWCSILWGRKKNEGKNLEGQKMIAFRVCSFLK